MILKYDSFEKIKEHVKVNNAPVVIYGAGMIGQVIMPYVISAYGLLDNLLFYVDANESKQRQLIHIGNRDIEIKSPEVLDKLPDNAILLITNSNYTGIVDMFNSIDTLKESIGVIIPVILAMRAKKSGTDNTPVGISGLKIPKVINYCWFSRSRMPDYLVKCIDSWKKFCPDYEIIRWDEDNYDVEKNMYMKQAYEAKKWGFVPDIARLDILYNYGGLYIDTDVEIIRNLDDLLVYEAFTGVEKWGNVNMGGCSGAVPHHPMIKQILDFRINEKFIMEDGSLNLTTCGYYETMPLIQKGFRPDNTTQTIDGMTVFSSDYFQPYDYMSGETCMTKNTHSIHHFNGGWLDKKHLAERQKTKDDYQRMVQDLRSF